MIVRTKQRAIGIGIMLVLTTFAFSTAHVIAEEYPVANAGGPYVSVECHEVLFDASGSYDPLNGTLEYRWNFMGNWTDWSYLPYTEFTWFDDYQGTVTLEVQARGLTAFDTSNVTVNNTPPVIDSIDVPSGPVNVGENVSVVVHFWDGDPRMNSFDTYLATFYWGDTTSTDYPHGSYGGHEGDMNITGFHAYAAPGVYNGSILLIDDNGGETSGTFTITVVGSAIFTVDAGPDGIINEGSLFISAGSFVSSLSGSFIGTVNYGGGSGPQPLPLNPDHTFALSHQYPDNGIFSITVTISRNDGANASDSALVTVNNVPPTALLMNNGPKDEGSPVTVMFTNQYDPGILDTFLYSFDWNNDGTYEISNQASPTMTHTWYDNGVYTVKGKIQDDDGGFTEYTTAVTIRNVPPTITSLSGMPTNPILLGTPINLVGVFTDPGTLDTHVALIAWGDNLSTTVNLAAGVYQVNRSHTYGSIGLYIITLKVTDDDGGSDIKSIESYVVVYNPNGGSVTGGGWLISPPGSYPANPTVSGRVNFGFVSQYKKGHIIPDGETEFQFQLANINFHSQGYEWLIIVGPKAMYQGTGTINGQGHYGFRLTAIDGKQSGGGGVDKLRMKIWDKDNNNQIVYDTDYGAPDSQNPSVALSGGQITIHK